MHRRMQLPADAKQSLLSRHEWAWLIVALTLAALASLCLVERLGGV